MKKTISALLGAMVMVLTLSLLSACDKSAEARLVLEVEAFNKKECPMNAGRGIVITKAVLDEQAKLMEYKMTYNERDANVAMLAPFMGEMKEDIASELVGSNDKDEKELVELLVKSGYGLKFTIEGKKTGQSVNATIPAEELAKLAGK